MYILLLSWKPIFLYSAPNYKLGSRIYSAGYEDKSPHLSSVVSFKFMSSIVVVCEMTTDITYTNDMLIPNVHLYSYSLKFFSVSEWRFLVDVHEFLKIIFGSVKLHVSFIFDYVLIRLRPHPHPDTSLKDMKCN